MLYNRCIHTRAVWHMYDTTYLCYDYTHTHISSFGDMRHSTTVDAKWLDTYGTKWSENVHSNSNWFWEARLIIAQKTEIWSVSPNCFYRKLYRNSVPKRKWLDTGFSASTWQRYVSTSAHPTFSGPLMLQRFLLKLRFIFNPRLPTWNLQSSKFDSVGI